MAVKSPPRYCECCGAKLVEYVHSLTKPLVSALMRLYRAGGQAHITELKLSYSQQCNFQKLRYFGFVERPLRNGVWTITGRGRDFLERKVAVRNKVWTFRGEVERLDGDRVYVDGVVGGYQTWERWALEAVPHAVASRPHVPVSHV